MRHLTGEGLALIKRFEGFAPGIYVCPGGWPTIGYGHVVRDGEQYRFGTASTRRRPRSCCAATSRPPSGLC